MQRSAMKRKELASALAREHRLTRAAARDQLDELVHKILKSLRKGGAGGVTRRGPPGGEAALQEMTSETVRI